MKGQLEYHFRKLGTEASEQVMLKVGGTPGSMGSGRMRDTKPATWGEDNTTSHLRWGHHKQPPEVRTPQLATWGKDTTTSNLRWDQVSSFTTLIHTCSALVVHNAFATLLVIASLVATAVLLCQSVLYQSQCESTHSVNRWACREDTRAVLQ